MITAFIIFLVSAVIFFIFAAATTHFIRKRDELVQDEPFELTEISNTTPTPTPVYEKKKRGRKPKTTK
jgi:hypothetical protein